MAKSSRAVSVAELGANPGRVVRRVRGSKQPLMVTERGRAQAVLLGVEAFERNERERQILRELARGEREIASGRGFSLEKVQVDPETLSRIGPALLLDAHVDEADVLLWTEGP